MELGDRPAQRVAPDLCCELAGHRRLLRPREHFSVVVFRVSRTLEVDVVPSCLRSRTRLRILA
jgi:hypothetical protein